jgi:hypothetical protein
MRIIKPEGNTSLAGVKDWAKNQLPPDNELRDTILSEEQDSIPRWEAMVKMDAYSRMLDAKFKLMTNGRRERATM